MKHLTYYYHEYRMDHLDNIKYFKKIKNKINNYVNLYAICDDSDFNWLI